MNLKEKFARVFGEHWISKEERIDKMILRDLPVLITEDRSIVCIPRTKEVFSAAISGVSGKGKSLLLHSMAEELFFNWKANLCSMNDSLEETFDWSKPNDNKEFYYQRFKYFNQKSSSLPIVYLFPNTNSLEIDNDKIERKNYLKITIPFEVVINNIEKFVKAVNPEFELGQSSLYLKNLTNDIEGCETMKEVEKIIEEKIPDKKGFIEMKYKIISAIRTLSQEQIINITNPEYPCYLEYDGYLDNPFSVLIRNGFIPSFITSDLHTKRYSPEIIAYYINCLFKNQFNEFKGEETYLLFDELTRVCSTTERNSVEVALSQVVARGRMARMGIIYVTQNYDKIPKIIKSAKMNFLFAFKHSNREIVNDIGKDFGLNNLGKEEIMNLETYECVAMTNDFFRIYKNNEVIEEENPISGRIIFPLSKHKTSFGR